MNILAIDPGLTGAWALLEGAKLPTVVDMPTVGKDVNPLAITSYLTTYFFHEDLLTIVLEAQQAMPGQGVSSSFLIGKNYGLLYGALVMMSTFYSGWQVVTVTPTTWKRAMHLTKDKEHSRTLALRRWPQLHAALARKKDHGRAEALLLGEYWRTHRQKTA